jgi:hypothetical protein
MFPKQTQNNCLVNLKLGSFRCKFSVITDKKKTN